MHKGSLSKEGRDNVFHGFGFIQRKPLAPDVVIDETWFSDPVFCEESKLWYMLAKTLTEEGAWKFAKENGIDLVAINPGLAIGPLLQPTLNPSVKNILNQLKRCSNLPK